MTDYNRMKIKDLRQIGKDMGLLRVDKNNKKDLIERLKKGKQLSDYNKNVLLDHARRIGILANAQMSEETILKKLTNPKLQDFGDERLREVAEQRGVRLRGTMTKKDIIKRIEATTAFYTIQKLKRLAEDNNIQVRRGITKTELINRLTEANIISPSKSIKVSNIGVLGDDDSLPLIASIKRNIPKNAREDLVNYKKYIQNIKTKYLTSRRLKQIQKTLEEKERKAEEERNRLFTPVVSESALRAFARVYTIKGIDGYDGETFLSDAMGSMTKVLRENKGTKVKLTLTYKMQKEVLDVGRTEKPFTSHSKIELNLEGTDENELYNRMTDTMVEKIQKLDDAEGSEWHFDGIINFQLHIVNYTPLRGSSYIKLPKFFESKGAIINMKNNDDKCFLWCVLRPLNLKDRNNERIDEDLKSKIDTLDMGDIKYPITSSKILGILAQAFYPHFTPFLPPRTTFSRLGPLLKNCFSTHKNAFRYIIQLHHHIIYLTYTSKSFQLNSISYIHTKQSSHNIYI